MAQPVSISISAPGTLLGATVGAAVYTAITTTGEIAGIAASSGIELGGNILGYGTELVAGSLAGETVRTLSRTYSAAARPAIRNTSRLGALGVSVAAGAVVAITASAVIYGGKKAGSYMYSYIEDYRKNAVKKMQYPIANNSHSVSLDDDILLVLDENDTIHSPLDL
jgi:hypothetical protein